MSVDYLIQADDLGDALLYSIDQILSGSAGLRKISAPTQATHRNNRTVVVAVLPDSLQYVVINCTMNRIAVENFDSKSFCLRDIFYKSDRAVQLITNAVNDAEELKAAMMEHNPANNNSTFAEVQRIRVIVKQLTGVVHLNLNSLESGALTNSTYQAIKSLLQQTAVDSSAMITASSKTKADIFTCSNGNRIELCRSAGKHTNSVLCCLDWMTENAPSLLKSRDFRLDSRQRIKLFDTIKDICSTPPDPTHGLHHLERIGIPQPAASKFSDGVFFDFQKAIIADLLLIALNANSQYVGAIAATYRNVKGK